MINLNTHSFTVYNTVPATDNANPQYGYRKVVTQCNAQQGYRVISDNNTQTVSNGTSFYSKDIATYLPPSFADGGFYVCTDKANHWTLAPGDFIVFDVVEDEINHASSSEYNALKDKYKGIGMTVGTATAYLNGLPIDHIEGVSK